MIKNVFEEYPELYHYTTATGIEGIVSTQTLRATNFTYVNDSKEFRGYFESRLPATLKTCVGPALAEAYKNNRVAKFNIDAAGGLGIATSRIESELQAAISMAIHQSYEPYLLSFSSPQKHTVDDGLLSQWRGYGTDGGYAIVFDTKGLNAMLLHETETYFYSYMQWGDVDYHDHISGEASLLPEMIKFQQELEQALNKYIQTSMPADLEATLGPLIGLSCMHKHIGFKEEAEVRIVAMPLSKDLQDQVMAGGETKQIKDYSLLVKNGTLVPYITLSEGKKLPIKKVIIGPHPDRNKRKKSVEMLLSKHGVEAEVTVSEIPYIGR